jgi:hypothetical protein
MLVGLDARDDQPGCDHLRSRGRPGDLHRRALAAVVHRPAGQPRRPVDSWAAVRLRLPLLLGSGGRDLRLHRHVEPARHQQSRSAACSPMMATAMPGAIRMSASRRCRDERLPHRSGPLPEPDRRFLGADQRLQAGQCRNRHRRRPIPPDFTTFWTRPSSRASRPKAASIGKAILFPQAVEALGDSGNNLSSEVWWSPSHPFKSSLNGLSAGEVAEAYTGDRQAVDPADRLCPCPVRAGVDVMGRVSDAGDGDAVAEAIAASNLQTIVGPIAFDGWPAAVCRPEHLQDARWSAASGGSRTAAATTSSSSTIPISRRSRPAARCSRSADSKTGRPGRYLCPGRHSLTHPSSRSNVHSCPQERIQELWRPESDGRCQLRGAGGAWRWASSGPMGRASRRCSI